MPNILINLICIKRFQSFYTYIFVKRICIYDLCLLMYIINFPIFRISVIMHVLHIKKIVLTRLNTTMTKGFPSNLNILMSIYYTY